MPYQVAAVVVEDNSEKAMATQMMLESLGIESSDMVHVRNGKHAHKAISTALSQSNTSILIALDTNFPSGEDKPLKGSDDGDNSGVNAMELIDRVLDQAQEVNKNILIILNSCSPDNNRNMARYIETHRNRPANVQYLNASQSDTWIKLQNLLKEIHSK